MSVRVPIREMYKYKHRTWMQNAGRLCASEPATNQRRSYEQFICMLTDDPCLHVQQMQSTASWKWTWCDIESSSLLCRRGTRHYGLSTGRGAKFKDPCAKLYHCIRLPLIPMHQVKNTWLTSNTSYPLEYPADLCTSIYGHGFLFFGCQYASAVCWKYNVRRST